MVVVCINDRDSITGKSLHYTKGKFYDVVSGNPKVDFMFYLKSDIGLYPAVKSENFVLLEDWREEKLKELGI